jgi:hypothetical protein
MTASDALMPLYGFVEGDTLGVVVLVRADDTVRALATRLLAATALRVAPMGEGRVMVRDQLLDPRSTLRGEGIRALDRVDLVWARDRGGSG